MRLSTSLLLALPLMAAAEGPLEQYKAQFQNFLGQFMPAKDKPVEEAVPEAVKTKAKVVKEPALSVLTMDNWQDTLYAPVKAGATKPEEWWVLISGRNKTCFGHCIKIDAAYDETAKKFATLPNTPHLAYINCDDQPLLCSTWSVAAGNLWAIDMLPPPAEIAIFQKRLNLTTTTAKTFVDLQALSERGEDFRPMKSWFHPFDGPLARNGLLVPAGYTVYYFNMVPSWALMLVVSFISRSFMTNRMQNQMNRGEGEGARPAAAR